MESVGISVANFPVQKTKKPKSKSCHPLLQRKNILKLNASHRHSCPLDSVTVNENNQKKAAANWLGRREVIGHGSLVGVLATLLSFPSNSKPAQAQAQAPCDFTSSPSGLSYCDQFLGTGPPPIKGQLIKAHYTGKLENGEVFDSSYNRGKPLTFRVGVGEVIRGWDEGILGTEGVPPMLPGGKRRLMIPPELGYGIRGAGCRGGSCIIPPNSVLYFDVEFVGKA
ncbi:unnamed protein product [Amaranthus hypochondriacus]